jgi:hypothetical protein
LKAKSFRNIIPSYGDPPARIWTVTHASIEDMAKSENISPSFVSRILRLAYLSPTIVEAILDGKYPAHLTMKDLMEPFPMDWERQREHFFGRGSAVQGG